MSIDLTSSTLSKSPRSLEVWKGQSLDIELEVVKLQTQAGGFDIEIPEDLTGATAKFTVRRAVGDPAVTFQKTTDNVAEIEILAPSIDGMMVVHIVPSDTENLDADTYMYDMWVELSSGDRGPVIEVSEFIVKEPITSF